MAKKTISERLESRSIPVPFSGCLIWTGGVNNLGYGRFSRTASAHRTSWSERYGDIPKGLMVLHKCDVRCCINPDHLYVGTQSDNMKDMWTRNRHDPVDKKGTKHHGAKLTEEQVLEIKRSPKHSKGLSKKYGVSNSRISAIRTGISWRHLNEFV